MYFYGKKAVSLLLCALLACTAFFACPRVGEAAREDEAALQEQIVVLYKNAERGNDAAQTAFSDGALQSVVANGQMEILLPSDPSQLDEVLAALRENPNVLAADLNCSLPLLELPNDPFVQPGGMAWYFSGVGADLTWDQVRGGSPVVIGVIDSGLDTAHPDLQGRIAPGYDYVRSRADVIDLNGHGTQVAGCAAAAVNNGIGVAGVSGLANVRIAPFRAGGSSSIDNGLNLGMVISAITEIVNNRPDIRIVNLSFGTRVNIETLEAAIRLLTDSGRIVVAAAGNNGDGIPMFPAYYDGVISVGATTASDAHAAMSCHNNRVDLTAPGVSFASTDKNGGYALVSGTSFSSPIVAGCAALLLAKNPSLTPLQAENALRVTSLDLGEPGRDDYFGAGRVQLDRALRYDNRTGALTIRNEAVGKQADKQKLFSFRLSVTAAGSYSYSGSYSGVLAHNDVIRLRSDEYVTITGLPSQAIYSVSELEKNADGYTTTAVNSSGVISPDGQTAHFTNRRGELPSGGAPAPAVTGGATPVKAYSLPADGSGIVWRANGEADFSVAAAREGDLLQVCVDGVTLTPATDFTLTQKDGRLIIRLLPSFTAKLQKEDHILQAFFTDGSFRIDFSADTLSLQAAPAVPATGGVARGTRTLLPALWGLLSIACRRRRPYQKKRLPTRCFSS